ncbi:PAS domain S-box protein [Candidatus Thorarchaeota archaeon]|nr:MAG: PAS domain S-box protein [Candidatus Thorarchaeota archaeon]
MQEQEKAAGLEDKYREVIMMANDGIMVIQDGHLAMVNPALARMLGFEADELEGKAIKDILFPTAVHLYEEQQERQHWSDTDRPIYRAGFRSADGELLNVEVSSSDFILDGQPASLGVVRDISQQIELEAAVESSEARYRALFDSSPIAYFTLSPRGNILQVNKAAEKLLGYSERDMLRRNLASFLPSEEREEIVRQVVSEVAQGRSVEDFELQMQIKDGRPTWVSVTASLLDYPDKTPSIALMAVDIDRRKGAEARERAQRERADLFLEVMTHDLNNINQTLLFSLGLLENSPDMPDEFIPSLQESSWNVRRAARMIANLRALMSLAESPPSLQEVDLYSHLKSASEAVEADLPWKKLNLKTNIDEADFSSVGHHYLHHVFFNILHNSMFFDEREDVEVEVTAKTLDDLRSVRIEFVDKGPGIADGAKEYVFRRTGSPDEQIVGRGLGLTLVDQIVRSLGGRAKVEDRVKGDHTKGTKVVVFLPLWAEQEELPCGRNTCITFYKSTHCLFCEPAMESLQSVLEQLGVPMSLVEVVDVDDPLADVDKSELPMLPCIRLCEDELAGFVSEEAIRNAVLQLAVKECYPDFL